MSFLDFKIDRQEEIPDKPLGKVEKKIVGATVELKPELPKLAGITFKLSASANGKVEAYNEKSDVDEDGVLGEAKEDEDAFGPVKLQPQIELTAQSAWLKYRLQASAGITADITAKAVGVPITAKIDASKKVVFADYRIHNRDENTVAAVLADAQKLRFAGNAEDAFKLAADEALYYQVRGEFSAKVSLSWSDVFTFGLSEIASVLQASELLTFKVSPTASIDFHVGVVDDFQLSLTRASASKVRVALKKGKSDEIGAGVGFQIVAQFADEEKAQEFLDAIYEAVLGKPLGEVKALLGKPEAELNKLISDLPAPAQSLINHIISRLKINNPLETLKDFKEQIENFEKKIKSTIEKIAKAKVEISFKYEYLRVHTNDALLVVQLDKETFKRFHNDLLLCDYINLLEWAKEKANINAVERFLNQDTIVIKESWGFSLSLSGIQYLKGIDEKEFKIVEQTDINGNKRLAYRFKRGYDAKFLDKFKWTVDFKAEMSKFVANPTTCDFDDVGLHIARTDEGTFKEIELKKVFDDALIWQILTADQATEAITEIGNDGYFNRKCKAVTQFTIKNSTLRKLLSLVATAPNDTMMSSALALAMPFTSRNQIRDTNLYAREFVYKSLWEIYFNDPDSEINNYVATAANLLRNLTIPGVSQEKVRDLYEYEKVPSSSSSPVYVERRETFAGVINLHHKSDYNSAINDYRLKFIEGLKDLGVATNNCRQHEDFNRAYKKIRPFFSQSFFVRAAGVYLIRLAGRNGLLSEINRSCTITYGDKVFNFGKAG